ncbi:MAG: hypothetical protein AB7O62_07420 [Pirellulales bacterium]
MSKLVRQFACVSRLSMTEPGINLVLHLEDGGTLDVLIPHASARTFRDSIDESYATRHNSMENALCELHGGDALPIKLK